MQLLRRNVLQFQVESWGVLQREAQHIFKVHYDELALHKSAMPMGIEDDFYLRLERAGLLLVVTARRNAELIGYFVAIIIDHHPHNKDGGKVSTTDMFMVMPKHRTGGAGAKLLMVAKEALRARGVKKATISTKAHFENARLMNLIWGEPTDIVRQVLL